MTYTKGKHNNIIIIVIKLNLKITLAFDLHLIIYMNINTFNLNKN